MNLKEICVATGDDSQGPRKLSDKQCDSDVKSALGVSYKQSKRSDQLPRPFKVMAMKLWSSEILNSDISDNCEI